MSDGISPLELSVQKYPLAQLVRFKPRHTIIAKLKYFARFVFVVFLYFRLTNLVIDKSFFMGVVILLHLLELNGAEF